MNKDYTKHVYALFFGVVIIGCFIPIQIAFMILNIDEIQSFYELLHHPLINHTYVTRIALENLDYRLFELSHLVYTLCTQLSYFNLLVIVLWSYLLAARQESLTKHYYIHVANISFTYVGGLLSIILIFLIGFQASSVGAVLNLIHICMNLFIGLHVLLLIQSGYALYVLYNKKK